MRWVREAAKVALGLWRAAGFLLAAHLASFAAIFMLTRLLGRADYGLFGLFQLAAAYATLFAQWGTEPLFTRALARGSALDHARTLAAFLRHRLTATAIVAAAGAAFLLHVRPDFLGLLLFAGLLEGALVACSNPPAFDAAGRIDQYQALVFVRQALYVAIVGAVFVSARAGALTASVAVIAAVHAASLVAQVVLEWRWIRKRYGALAWPGTGREANRLWIDAFPLAVTTSAGYLLDLAGQTALPWTSRRGELPDLVLSNQIAMVATSFVGLASRWFLVHVSRLAEDPTRLRRRVLQAIVLFTAAGLAASAFGALVVSTWIPFLFTEKFRPAAGVFAIDAWRIAGVLVGSAAAAGLVAQHRIRTLAVSTLFALATAAATAALSVESMGARGAALAVAVGRAAFAVVPTVAFFLPFGAERPGSSVDSG